MKKITFQAKPTGLSGPQASDHRASDRQFFAEPIKRLTIDVPLSLHQRFKSQCALKGENMADVMRMLLERHFAEAAPSPDEAKGEGSQPAYRNTTL